MDIIIDAANNERTLSMNRLSIFTLAAAGLISNVQGQQLSGNEWIAARGASVAKVLGARLPEVANHYGVTTNELQDLFARENSIATDKDGNLLYACCAPTFTSRISRSDVALAGTATGTSASSGTAPFPTENTFLLHSRPNSNKKIYLDFNGHTTTGTYWNNSYNAGAAISTPAFDFDGNTAAFSLSELTRIQLIWARVCEDYSLFDVDVTTEEPSLDALSRINATDTTFGIRVCIGGNSTDWFKASAGGVAYVGSFNASIDMPCFVFATALGNNEKYVADSASHEIGHTLGLYHDGLVATSTSAATEYYAGHSNWAPIMGAGYAKAITQWSKGEYNNANNKQDDIAVMQTYGVSLRGDDHGDTILTATSLSGTSISATGIISTRADTDVFKFTTGAGSITFNAATASPDSNLDIQLALYDGTGNLVTFANPVGLASTLTATVSAGTYYIALDGMAFNTPINGYSDYGSLGQYFLTGSVVKDTNKAPTAVASALNVVGTAPFKVTFSNEGTFDVDGTIASNNWDFGDSTAQVTSPTPLHTYTTPGTYTASLVATDNGGLSATSTVTITVLAPKAAISISKIDMIARNSNGSSKALAMVLVRDAEGNPVAGANVTGTWSGDYTGSFTAVTNSIGIANFFTPKANANSTFTFSVSSAVAPGRTYLASNNTVSSITAIAK
jgi:PKD repeat protein